MLNTQLKQTRFVNARKEWREVNRIRLNFERSVIRRLVIMFNEIGVNASEKFITNGKTGLDLYLTKTRTLVESTMMPFYFSIIKEFSERFEKFYSKKLEDAKVQSMLDKFIFGQGSQRITNIDDTTRKRIQSIISKSAREGLGEQAIARNIEQTFKPQFSRRRASVIARTEVHSASTFANHSMATDLASTGVVLKKRWVANTDDRVRNIHSEANGKEVGMEEDFTVGGMPMKYTGDPRGGAKNVINCRCTTLYLEEETTVYDSPTATSTTRMPKKTFYGYGNVIPEERIYLNDSLSEAPLRIKNIINLFPATTRIYQDGSQTAYATVTGGAVKYTRGTAIEPDLRGNAVINMSNYSNKTLSGQNTFRHEYGHVMDFQIGRILPKNRQKPDVDYNKRRLEQEKFSGREGSTELMYSANYVDEINADKALLRIKHPEMKVTSKNFEDQNNYVSTESRKAGFNKVNDGGVEVSVSIDVRRITRQDMEYALADGKLFTKKELLQLIGGNKIDSIDEILDTIKKTEFKTDAIVYEKLMLLRYYNQKGTFGTGGTKYSRNIFGKIDFLQQYALRKGKFGGADSASEYIKRKEFLDTFADYLGAITNEKVGYGHGLGYYVKFGRIGRGLGSGNSTEAFAEYMAIAGADDEIRDIYFNIYKKFAPNTTKGFDEVIDELERYVDELNN